MVPKRRKRAIKDSDIELLPPSSSPIPPDYDANTPHRVRLLTLNKQFAGKIAKPKIFTAINIASERTGYRILVEGTSRRSERIKNRGRIKAISDHELRAIETVEDSSFQMGILPYKVVADYVGVSHDKSERIVQRNMADFRVNTYVAAQGKWLTQENLDGRVEHC